MRLFAGRMRLVLTALVLGLCSTMPLAPLQAAPRILTPVSVFAFATLLEAPILIAMEEGYFAEQGVEIRLSELRDASQGLTALITGQLDVHTIGYTAGLMQAILQGAKLRIVADKGHAGPGDTSNALMVRQDLIDSGRFRTIKDLQGMRIGLVSRGGIGEMFLSRLLANHAFLTERDVDIRPLPPPLLVDAFRTRAIDAAVLVQPFVTRFETLGVAKAVATLNEVLPRVQYSVVIYGPTLLARNPGLGQRFMNGYLRGVQQYQSGKTDRNIAIVQKYTREDEALIRKMPWPLIHPDGHVNVESILQTQAWWVRKGLLERAVSPEQFLDATFARRAFHLLSATR